MTTTIEGIARLPGLDLRIVTDGQGLERTVRWVHVSELADPAPWLQGDELLLTTGLEISEDAAWREYVRRLAAVGLAGIGFGVGVAHAVVPPALIQEANRLGMPVLLVPLNTPYISISKAVSDLLTEERYDAISRAHTAQQELTRAAVAGSIDTIVHEVARQLRGWAMFTDSEGRLKSAWPTGAGDRLPELLPDLFRARDASAIVSPSESTVIHALTIDGAALGYLLAGVERTIGAFERLVLQAAVAILTLEAEQSRSMTARLRRLQADTLRALLHSSQPPQDAARHVISWGLDPFSLRICVHLLPEQDTEGSMEAVLTRMTNAGQPGAACSLSWRDGFAQIVVLTAADAPHGGDLFAPADDGGTLGISDLGTVDRLRQMHVNALNAATIGQLDRRSVTRFDELPAMQLLLAGEREEVIASFTTRVLGELARPERGSRLTELRTTLEVFLTHNGHWNEAATALGIHRHTLKARIERVAALTGRDPESAYGRMELWLALLADNLRVQA